MCSFVIFTVEKHVSDGLMQSKMVHVWLKVRSYVNLKELRDPEQKKNLKMLETTYGIANSGRVATRVWLTGLKSNGCLISK